MDTFLYQVFMLLLAVLPTCKGKYGPARAPLCSPACLYLHVSAASCWACLSHKAFFFLELFNWKQLLIAAAQRNNELKLTVMLDKLQIKIASCLWSTSALFSHCHLRDRCPQINMHAHPGSSSLFSFRLKTSNIIYGIFFFLKLRLLLWYILHYVTDCFSKSTPIEVKSIKLTLTLKTR